MKESFLEYTKFILEKVSFDVELLKKEYKKSLKILKRDEILQLNSWVKRQEWKLQLVYISK